jgi:hypothetical protein
MTETLRTVAETAVCRTCDFQVTAFSSRIALQRAGNTSRITLSSSLLGGAPCFSRSFGCSWLSIRRACYVARTRLTLGNPV